MTHRETAILLAINETLARFEVGPAEALCLGVSLASSIGVGLGVPLTQMTVMFAQNYEEAEGLAATERMRQAV